MAITLSTGPAIEPVTLAQAKAHLRFDSTDENDLITTLISVARRKIEQWEWRAHITQTWTLKLDAFPKEDVIYLPRPPLQSVSSVKYLDGDGVLQTVDSGDYDVDSTSEPGRLKPAYGEVWPTPRTQMGAVTICFVAGYGDAATDVPEQTRQAILLLVGHLFRNREAVSEMELREVPMTVAALLEPVYSAAVLECL